MDKIVLSIHYGHNATVGISINGKVECVLSEERLTRIKNATGFPFKALDYIVSRYLSGDKSKISKVVLNDYELAGVQSLECRGYEPKRYQDYYCYTKKKRFFKHFCKKRSFSSKLKSLFLYRHSVRTALPFSNGKQELLEKISNKIGVSSSKLELLDHHSAHMLAPLYFVNSDNKYLCFSIDGEGDSSCAKVAIWENGKLQIISENHPDNSLGLLYMRVTAYLGMKPNEHEFKVMGMAPYAKESQVNRVKKVFEDYMWLDDSGKFVSRTDVPSCLDYLVENLLFERFDNVCGAIQLFTEELTLKWITYWLEKTKVSDVIVSGGVMMNVKAVKRIYETDSLSSLFVTPSSGDESLVIGGMFHGNALLKQPMAKMTDLYLGTENEEEEVEGYLRSLCGRYTYEKLDEEAMAKRVAALLADNEIVARCCGREEWGARALGNRSILCNASQFKNLDLLNQYIKDRDFWMPFTPSVIGEDVDKYIVNPRKMPLPYMCITFDSTPLAREHIPAALHPHDYTVRPQAVYSDWNPAYYAILKEFKKLTGLSGVLNTSFNLHGEPNVCTYKDAIHTLDNSKLMYVILGSFLVTKRN